MHVVCPSVWAWRPGRVKQFNYGDYMLCLFPFELEYCANVNKQAFYWLSLIDKQKILRMMTRKTLFVQCRGAESRN